MAWIEDEPWAMEQGIDALKEFELVDASGNAWPFNGWDVNATISDARGRSVVAVTVTTQPNLGKVKLVLPEAIVNELKVGRAYRYDCLMVAPGAVAADDHVLATGPATVALRTTRRDQA